MMNLSRQPIFFLLIGIIILSWNGKAAGQHLHGKIHKLNMQGEWAFQLDPHNLGLKEEWYKYSLKDSIHLPGSLQRQGYGNEPDMNTRWIGGFGKRSTYPDWFESPMYAEYRTPSNFKFPYLLNPEKHYVGKAWYQKVIHIPRHWKGKRIQLYLERVHWISDVWIDNQYVGGKASHSVPHRYNLTDVLTPGEYTVTLRVDNSLQINVGKQAHSVTDHTQTAWNGIIGQMYLEATEKVWVRTIQIFPDVMDNYVRIEVELGNLLKMQAGGDLHITVQKPGQKEVLAEQVIKDIDIAPGDTMIRASLPLGANVELWNEFSPSLFSATVTFKRANHPASQITEPFGLRNIAVKNNNFLLNGQRLFLRGNLICGTFPDTGYPPTDIKSWKRILQINKNYGFNHIRFHSWCPPEAAFEAADQLGMYLQPEAPFWQNINTEEQAEYLVKEAKQMLSEYGNHPSFVFYAHGNEFGIDDEINNSLLETLKKDNRRLYTGVCNSRHNSRSEYQFYVGRKLDEGQFRFQDGWPPRPENSLFVTEEPSTNIDFEGVVQAQNLPLVTHEIGQRAAYPPLRQRSKFDGFLYPAILDIAADQLRENNINIPVDSMVWASGRWQLQQYKEEIEAQLRTEGIDGYQLLQLQDFPGQGGALVGFLDSYWDSKGYVTPTEFKQFNSPTVPLARMEKRVFLSDETFLAKVEAAHFGSKALTDVPVHWQVKSDGKMIKSGSFGQQNFPTDNGIYLGQVKFSLSTVKASAKYTLQVLVGDSLGYNTWDFWVFPQSDTFTKPRDFLVVNELDNVLIQKIQAGASVLLLPDKAAIKGNIEQCFSSVYWNCPHTNGGESQTLGIFTNPDAPVFKTFPTEAHSNWHWYELLVDTRPLNLTAWPTKYRPIISMIDDWNQNRKLGILAEAKLGKGKVMICAMDIQSDLEVRPVAAQFRKSLFHYLASEAFQPDTEISSEQLKSLFFNR